MKLSEFRHSLKMLEERFGDGEMLVEMTDDDEQWQATGKVVNVYFNLDVEKTFSIEASLIERED
jgi:hypothetical protein